MQKTYLLGFSSISDSEAVKLTKSIKSININISLKGIQTDLVTIDKLLTIEKIAPLMRKRGRLSRSASDHYKLIEKIIEDYNPEIIHEN